MTEAELMALLMEQGQQEQRRRDQDRARRDAALQAQLQLQAKRAPDLSGLGATVDAIYGTKIAPAMMQQVQRQDQDEDALLKMLMQQEGSAAGGINPLSLLRDKQKDDRQEKGQLFTAFKDVKNDLAKAQAALEPIKKSLDIADAAISSLNRAEITQSLSLLARNISENKGALAEGDIERQFMETTSTRLKRFAEILGGKGSAKLDPSEVQELVAQTKNARKIIEDITKKATEAKIDTYRGNPVYAQAINQAGGKKGGLIKGLDDLAKDIGQSKIDFEKAKISPLTDIPGSGVVSAPQGADKVQAAKEGLRKLRGK